MRYPSTSQDLMSRQWHGTSTTMVDQGVRMLRSSCTGVPASRPIQKIFSRRYPTGLSV